MNKLSTILEDFKDGQEVLVSLKNNDEFILYDFEMIDESIYDRSDLVMASVKNVVKSKFIYREETKIEISIDDIVKLRDPDSGLSFYPV